MERVRLKLSVIALSAAGLGGAAPAQASIGFGILPVSIAVSAIIPPQSQCLVPAVDTGVSGSISKTAAILGGKLSQLELIAAQQAGGNPLQPANTAMASQVPGSNCLQFALRSIVQSPAGPVGITSPPGPDDFLASARVSIKHTGLDASWNRVRRENLPRGLSGTLAALGANRSGPEMLGAVNAWTNARVRNVDDAVQYGQADYWASAKLTLARGAGDCEDVAIAKMQILAAMGVGRSDMYLTITRDLIRNADHAVLIVKADGKFWLLDNASDQLLDAATSNNYRPIMSFSTSRSWLHGNWHPTAR